MIQLYLSRRNLLTLLAKLDGRKDGVQSECTIVKLDTLNARYPLTGTDAVSVTAVEDEDYYYDREPGPAREG